MLRSLAALIFSSIIFISCNSEKKGGSDEPMSETNVAIAFIRGLLDNKLDDAEKYLLKNEENQQYFDALKAQYKRKSPAELTKFKNAAINFSENPCYVTDSVCIISYSNSYNPQVKNKLKLVRINGKWLVDFQYTFSGNM